MIGRYRNLHTCCRKYSRRCKRSSNSFRLTGRPHARPNNKYCMFIFYAVGDLLGSRCVEYAVF